MRVLVFGAAGKTGSAVVEAALAAGHQVSAFVQHAEAYGKAGVRVFSGDATHGDEVLQAVEGQDAVVDTIGGKTPYKGTTLEQTAAATIISAMQQAGVRRLIATSMLGVGESTSNAPLYERLLVSTFLRGAEKDKTMMEDKVQSSGLDWIILRPAILTDDAAIGQVKVYPSGTDEKAHKIARSDLANFIVAQLVDDTHLHQAIAVASS